jgi:hypothetical protein
MSLHKLSAGHGYGYGYDYMIRQVAALDATHRGRTDLAIYHTERGEAPGRWVSRGLAGVDGLDVGDVVTGEQMRLLSPRAATRLPKRRPAVVRCWRSVSVPAVDRGAAVPGGIADRFADHNTALGVPR